MNSKTSTSSTSVSVSSSPDAVSRRAYEIWENEGRPEGCELRHWLQAEQELGASSTPGASPASRASETARHTDTRPLQGTRAAGAAAREPGKRSTTAPFERGAPAGGAQPANTKRR